MCGSSEVVVVGRCAKPQLLLPELGPEWTPEEADAVAAPDAAAAVAAVAAVAAAWGLRVAVVCITQMPVRQGSEGCRSGGREEKEVVVELGREASESV